MFDGNQVILETSDKRLADDLMSLPNKMGKASMYMQRSGVEETLKFIIEFSSAVEIGLFTSWLYDRVKNQKTEQTFINKQEITNNITQINVVMKSVQAEKANSESNG